MPPLAEFENVSKFYGSHQALGPVTLALPEASVGLLGPNGAGKSTLLRLLLGMIPPTSGTIRVLGEEVQPGGKALRGKVGYAPEGEAVFPGLDGVEAVAFAGQLVGMRKVDALQRAHQVLDYVQLGEARYRLVEKYSTGMRQRLKLAQALVHDPQLIVLDEPTEGVDPEARMHLLDLLGELEQEHGIKLLISTHLLHDAERLVSHALVLHEGRAIVNGPLSDLKRVASAGYAVRVHGPVEALVERLRAQGIESEPLEPGLRVATEDALAVLQAAQESGVVVRHLAPTEMTLDDAFAHVLAQSQAEPAPPPEVAPDA